MKKLNGKRILPLVLAGSVLVSSCTTSTQAAGGITGAAIGSSIGESIGWLSGHGYHGRSNSAALGSLIGMGVGAVLGVGIASAIEENEKEATNRGNNSRHDDYDYDRSYDYGYQIGGGERGAHRRGGYQIDKEGLSSTVINISELTYMDENGDGNLSKNETIEVEGYVTNTSNSVINDIVIYMSTNDEKLYSVSPSLTTSLQPGQRIKYTGRIYCKKVRDNSVRVTLSTLYDNQTQSSDIYIRLK